MSKLFLLIMGLNINNIILFNTVTDHKKYSDNIYYYYYFIIINSQTSHVFVSHIITIILFNQGRGNIFFSEFLIALLNGGPKV